MKKASTRPVRDAGNAARLARAHAHWQAGLARAQVGDWVGAQSEYARAVDLAPRDALYWTNLGNAQRKQGEFRAATESARRAFELDKSNLLACKLYGTCLMEQHRWEDAIAAYGALDPATPRDHVYHLDFGQAYFSLQRINEAIEHFIASFTCKPDFSLAHARLGLSLAMMGMNAEAAECFRTVAALNPGDAQAWSNVVHQSQYACVWSRLDEDMAKLNETIRASSGGRTTPFSYISMENTAADQLLCARLFSSQEFAGIRPMPALERGVRAPGERIRVGYLSSDFHQHATSMLMVELLESHDRSRFDITLYSHGTDDGSALRARIIASSEHFTDVSELSDIELAQRIRDDGIDILVDLKGHTRDTRTRVLGRRPAPIQVQYLGFPGTLGTDFVDYVIGDATVTPREHAPFYTEKIAQMRGCYQPNDSRRPLPEAVSRDQCGLPPDVFVFCSFNQTYKILPRVFDRWCSMLRQVPDSVLWLFSATRPAMENLRMEAGRRGIDASRLIFAPFVRQDQHIARLRNADLFIDTFPCHAHTTASDALWAGVPLLTCIGETFASRVAASLLRAVGLPDMVVASLDEYEARAIELARDREQLSSMRRHLALARTTSALFDGRASARALEDVFMRMYERLRLGLAPDFLAASDEAADASGRASAGAA